MISCNNGESMQMREVRLMLMARRHGTPDVETWCAEIQGEIGRADSELLGLYHSPFADFI